MPFTPYHFGPCGFIGLLFRRWIHLPVFLFANVLIDFEVLADIHFDPGWPVHRMWHFHTFLVGGIAGGIFGACIYLIKPLRELLELILEALCIPHKSTLVKTVLSGIFGMWSHVLIDGIYHYDVQPFWPQKRNMLWKWFSVNHRAPRDKVEMICLIGWAAAILLYAVIIVRYIKNKRKGLL